MKINFSKVIIKNIKGELIENIHQVIGGMIYERTKDLSLVELAIKIYKGEEVELSQLQVEEIKRLINENATQAFVKKALLEYIDKV